MTETHLQVLPTVSSLSQAAADLFVRTVREAAARRPRCLVALSGGNTPVPFFRLLAQPAYRRKLPWERIHFFWADARCVPPGHPESNYGQAYDLWLAHVPLPEENMHRVKGELKPADAASDYRQQLLDFAGERLRWPRFDFVLLGLGTDGHTASLFPGSPVDPRPRRSVITARKSYQDRPSERISLTAEVFNSSRLVCFLVAGAEKAEALAASHRGRKDPVRWPAQRIRPPDGKVYWLVDAEAASFLPESIRHVSIT